MPTDQHATSQQDPEIWKTQIWLVQLSENKHFFASLMYRASAHYRLKLNLSQWYNIERHTRGTISCSLRADAMVLNSQRSACAQAAV